MKKGDNIRLRSDGRYEARYIRERDAGGKIVYGYCYGKTYDEAKEKRDYQLQRFSEPKPLNLLILGAGLHGSDVYEIAKSLRVFTRIEFLDDDRENRLAIGVWSDAERLTEDFSAAIVAVGDEDVRRNWTKKLSRLGYVTPILIHPTAYVSEDAEIGAGSVIYPRATVAAGVHIGTGSIVTTGSTVPRKTYIPDWGYFENGEVLHYKNHPSEAVHSGRRETNGKTVNVGN